MKRMCAMPMRSLRLMAIGLLVGGAAFSAPPIAHAINRTVSAARSKTIWAEWKRSFAQRSAQELSPQPGQPAFWLRVPTCQLSVLAMHESDSEALHRFPAVRRIEINDGMVVSAHRDTHFRPLQKIHVGDLLLTESADGHVTHYKVRTVRILLPEEIVSAVGSPECREALHLLTCYPFRYFGAAPKRFLVTAFPVEEREGS